MLCLLQQPKRAGRQYQLRSTEGLVILSARGYPLLNFGNIAGGYFRLILRHRRKAALVPDAAQQAAIVDVVDEVVIAFQGYFPQIGIRAVTTQTVVGHDGHNHRLVGSQLGVAD